MTDNTPSGAKGINLHQAMVRAESRHIEPKQTGASRSFSFDRSTDAAVTGKRNRYRTIVADPPWPIGDFPANFGYSAGKPTPYKTLSIEEITALPVRELSDNRGQDAHLYLWTIDQFLERSFAIARSWGFRHSATITWCKPPFGVGLGGTWPSNVEFVLFCRRPAYVDRHGSLEVTRWLRDRVKEAGLTRSSLAALGGYTEGQLVHWLAGTETVGAGVPPWDEWVRLKQIVRFGDAMDERVRAISVAKRSGQRSEPLLRAPGRWFEWPRSSHSQKPEAFLDLVEQVSPGPYLELFARRQRLGWDTWGNEALEHVELSAEYVAEMEEGFDPWGA